MIPDGKQPAVVHYADDDFPCIDPLHGPRRYAYSDSYAATTQTFPFYHHTNTVSAGQLMADATTYEAEMGMEGRGFRFTWNQGPITPQKFRHPRLILVGGRPQSRSLG